MIGTLLLARMRRADFHAVELGQHQVEHDQIGFLERALEAREPVARRFDLVAFVLEFEFEHAQDLRVVLDDEHFIGAVGGRGRAAHKNVLGCFLTYPLYTVVRGGAMKGRLEIHHTDEIPTASHT